MDKIIDPHSSDTWKNQLTIAINFISSKNTEKHGVMYSMSNNIKSTSYNDVNEVVNDLFKSLLSKYQDNLETSMRGNEFIFDSVHLLYYKSHKVNSKGDRLYIDSPD